VQQEAAGAVSSLTEAPYVALGIGQELWTHRKRGKNIREAAQAELLHEREEPLPNLIGHPLGLDCPERGRLLITPHRGMPFTGPLDDLLADPEGRRSPQGPRR
jgi:hypothetical protein